MASPVVLPLVTITINASGGSETITVNYDFSSHPAIQGGDTLSSSQPTITDSVPPGAPPLTISTPATLSGNIWSVQESVVGGIVNSLYRTTCTAQTTRGQIIDVQIPVLLTGTGTSPPASPVPSNAQAARTFYRGPVSGPSASPFWGNIQTTDLPAVTPFTNAANSFTIGQSITSSTAGEVTHTLTQTATSTNPCLVLNQQNVSGNALAVLSQNGGTNVVPLLVQNGYIFTVNAFVISGLFRASMSGGNLTISDKGYGGLQNIPTMLAVISDVDGPTIISRINDAVGNDAADAHLYCFDSLNTYTHTIEGDGSLLWGAGLTHASMDVGLRRSAVGMLQVTNGAPNTALGGLNAGQLRITNPTASQQAVVVQAASGQSTNLVEWQDHTSTILSFIGTTGNAQFPSLFLAIPNATTTGLTIKAVLGQSNNLLQLEDHNSTGVAAFDANGCLIIENTANINFISITDITTGGNLKMVVNDVEAALYTTNAFPLTLGANGSLYLTITTAGSVVAGAGAVLTTATDGFLYVPTCAGAPTGTPTAQSGREPIVVDTTNGKIWTYYGGSWHFATLT